MKRFLPSILAVVLLLLIPSSVLAQGKKMTAPGIEKSDVVQSEPAQSDTARPDVIQIEPDKSSIMPISPREEKLPFGQTHFYTVTLRGNGEALVYLKTIFSNKDQSPLAYLQFTFPSTPENLVVYQVIREPQCIRYGGSDTLMGRPGIERSSKEQNCLEYQEPDYQYGWGNSTFEKAQVIVDGTNVTITLPRSVKSGDAGSLLFSYGSKKITDKDLFGAYNFIFDTVKINDTIQNLQVGITTDPDYYLKDTKGEIGYQAKEAAVALSAMPAMDRIIGNAQFDQFYNQIGYGTIVKNVTNLQPNESYSVKGSYADNKMKLYAKEITWGVVITVVLLALAFAALFFGMRKGFSKAADAHAKATVPVLLVSFGSSLFVLLYTLGLYLVSTYFSQMFMYYPSGGLFPVVMLLVAVISLCIYSLFLFVPSVLLGFKKGAVAGIVTFVLTLFWLILYGIIVAVLFFVFFKGNQPSPVVMMGAAKSMEVSATTPVDDVMYTR